jgi:hypothetical protein
MADIDCPIWGTPATETRDSNGENIHVFSHRAGGIYTITGSAVQELKGLSFKDKLLLTTWLCEQRALGVTDPRITTYTLKETQTRRPLSVSQRINAALLFFNGIRLGDVVAVSDSDFSNAEPGAGSLAALTECEEKEELLALLALMGEMGLLADQNRILGRHEYSPTAKGWMRIEELMLNVPDTAQAFVAMWFNSATDSAYSDGIAQAITNCGYRPLRIDNKEHANKIDDEIIAEIRRSRFLVADFTCEKGKPRGGVYYEAGFAAGLSVRVIWTCHKDSIDDLHLDTRQYNHIVWDAPEDLRVKLEARIGAVMGDGPLPKPPKDAG